MKFQGRDYPSNTDKTGITHIIHNSRICPHSAGAISASRKYNDTSSEHSQLVPYMCLSTQQGPLSSTTTDVGST